MCSEGKEVVLAQVICYRVRSVFYVVDLEADKVCRTPVATLLNETGAGGLVRLGSVIYIAGGELDDSDEDSNCRRPDDEDSDDDSDGNHHFHTWASCLDLSKPHLISLLKEEDAHCDYDNPLKSKSGSGSGSTSMRWKGFPAMYYEREYPACASLGGKIYALGGSAPTSCIGEVFMPESGEWKSVVSPPSDLPLECHCVSSPLIPDEKNERLLVHFNNANALYAYYPANGKWDCLAHNFCRWFPATALVDGVLYSHVEGTCDCLVAYDVMTKSWLEVVYSPHFPVEVCISNFPSMFHLGNDMLCLANSSYIIKTGVRIQHTNLQFVKFRVKRTTPTEVLVTPVAINCFPFKKHFTAINFIAL